MQAACESPAFSHIANECHPAENARAPAGTAGLLRKETPPHQKAGPSGWECRDRSGKRENAWRRQGSRRSSSGSVALRLNAPAVWRANNQSVVVGKSNVSSGEALLEMTHAG